MDGAFDTLRESATTYNKEHLYLTQITSPAYIQYVAFIETY